MTKSIGILTAGGDSPGLNAAIRGIGKAAQTAFGMHVIGFRDGFRGLMENRTVRLEGPALSGILTVGGTLLGASRDKPHRMPVGSKVMDMTDVMADNYHKHHLDVLVCLGGGGTQKNAFKLAQKGLNIITLPKTIDNDVAMTDVTFGFDTALLGHLQRGGTPSAADRLLATRLGTACAALINEGVYGIMVAARGDSTESVPLEQVVGKRKTVPLDHPWIESARYVGTCLGD